MAKQKIKSSKNEKILINSNRSYQFTMQCKRGFDIIFSALGLIILLPLFPIIAVAIKLDSKGSILFSQIRIGRISNDKVQLFTMYKFRTMRSDAEKLTGAVWATKQDPRITYVGNFLRKTRLDEIPQLWNVLKGDMSLIGPRPERPGFYHILETEIPYFAERTYGLAPGITGLAQINQGYDSCINDVRRKVGFDHAYALCLNTPWQWLKMDLYIIYRTLIVMIGAKGR